MRTKPLDDRAEVEAAILGHLEAIHDIAKAYDPGCKYLSMFINFESGYITGNNDRYRRAGPERPSKRKRIEFNKALMQKRARKAVKRNDSG